MKNRLNSALVLITLVVLLSGGLQAHGATPTSGGIAALGAAFTYQGHLTDGGSPANGAYDLQFILYDAENGGSQVGSIVTRNDVTVIEGLFTVYLDFGVNAFTGSTRYLEVSARPGSSTGAYTTLNPRQLLSPTPYALYSASTGALQGRTVSASTPQIGQVLRWDGTQWVAASTGHDHYGASWSGSAVKGLSVATSSSALGAAALYGQHGAGAGADSGNPAGVFGSSDSNIGVRGASKNSIGVYGKSNGGTGVYGASDTGYAGYFAGKVRVLGFLEKPGGGFMIDHPLDPANTYLYHSFVESPDMKNIYDGLATLDAKGAAVVELPAWFDALNQEFRYQLTAIGASAPDLYIAKEIQGNRFTIAGGKPGMKVSWQVTGVRHDPWAEQHRMQVEVKKPAQERGKYLYPAEYGQPEALGIDYAERQQAGQANPQAPAQSR
jgi:hypothetical protein